MAKLTKTVYLTIHGHFYQPPRENPWIGKIEPQPDAGPFHDWNDRILIQCYQPNAMARIVDSQGKVLEIVNNFRFLSFNVGPTLLDWLEKRSPLVYLRILEGDRLSLQEHSGHGNAIAQVYNHMILPLAPEEDQRTQIRWGIFEFKRRFGRDPEGIWLPETAASERTLEILIEEGLRFTILAADQARATRPLHLRDSQAGGRTERTTGWQDVSKGSIDPTRPYRFFHSKEPGRSIDLFFFDGVISREASFGDLLFDSKKVIDRLLGAHRSERQHPELINLATDGETFGHHKAFGERVIAFLLHEEVHRHGFKQTNYGEYLEKFPPQFEVKIREGEGTSWSCSHGVSRWKDDCGCRTGGEPGWNQKWRRPLREAVRFLSWKLAEIYKKESPQFLKDPAAARDGYIEVILDRSRQAQDRFFEKHAIRTLRFEERIKALQLLEMERYAMLTETSCGWFFSDLSGIETVQILRYALRAIELAAEFTGENVEEEFVGRLAQATSNRREFGNGRGVWEKLVKPARVSQDKLVAHFALRKIFGLGISREDFYDHEIEEGESEQESVEERTLLMGGVRITRKTVPESQGYVYAVFREGPTRIWCFVKRSTGPAELQRLNVAPLGFLRKGEAAALLKNLRASFATDPLSLKDLFPEEKDEILRILSREMREDLYQIATRFYEKGRPEMAVFRESGRLLPDEFRELMEWMMGERLFELVQKLDGRVSFEEVESEGKKLLDETHGAGLAVRTRSAVDFLSAKLNRWIEKLFEHPDLELVRNIERVLGLAKELRMTLHDRIAQDLFFVFAEKILREWIGAYQQESRDQPRLEMIQSLLRLGDELGFNMSPYENQLKSRVGVR